MAISYIDTVARQIIDVLEKNGLRIIVERTHYVHNFILINDAYPTESKENISAISTSLHNDKYDYPLLGFSTSVHVNRLGNPAYVMDLKTAKIISDTIVPLVKAMEYINKLCIPYHMVVRGEELIEALRKEYNRRGKKFKDMPFKYSDI